MFSECMYTYVIHIETYDIQSYIDIYVNVYTYMNLGQCSFRLLTCFFHVGLDLFTIAKYSSGAIWGPQWN